MPDDPSPSPPTALLRPAPRRASVLPWLIPIAALIIAAVLILQALAARGPRLTLAFDDGRGLRPGDPIVHRGVPVGRVLSIGFGPSSEVRIRVELIRDAAFLKNSGRFWIVHPELSLTRVSGLDTLLGPRYIEADIGRSSTSGNTLESPPPRLAEGLNISIRASRAGSLAPGSPVSFRESPVGSVTHVELAPDGRSVVIHINIRPEHAHLVRTNSRFWNVSGIGLDLGLVGGLKLKAESLQTVLAGGLAFATPDKPTPGDPVATGHEFDLSEFDDAALKWSPDLTLPPP